MEDILNRALDQENEALAVNGLMTIISTFAGVFLCVCAGIWLLRKSKQKPPQPIVNQQHFQLAHDRPESSQPASVLRQKEQTQQSHAAKVERVLPKLEDKKYWPPSAR